MEEVLDGHETLINSDPTALVLVFRACKGR
jgi:hypothetical protein